MASQQTPITPAPAAPLTPPPANDIAQPLLPNVPEPWPGAWGLYKYSKQAVVQHWMPLLGLVVTYGLIGNVLPVLILPEKTGRLVGEIIALPLSVALIAGYLRAVRGQQVVYGDAVKSGLDVMLCLKLLGAGIISSLISAISLLLLIVPFFFVAPRLMLMPFLVVDKKLGPLEAYKVSWEATKSHVGRIWGVIGVFVAIALLMITVIGIPFSLYFLFMYGAALALLYEFIMSHQVVPAAATSEATSTPATPPDSPPVG